MNKTIQITPPEGYEVDKEKSTFEKIVFKRKIGLPDSWEDLETIKGYSVGINSAVYKQSNLYVSKECDKSVFSSKELAKASLAIAQLSQLRKVAWEDWKPDWSRGNLKYSIFYSNQDISVIGYERTLHFLTFQTEKIAQEFLDKYRDLIEKARPILGG